MGGGVSCICVWPLQGRFGAASGLLVVPAGVQVGRAEDQRLPAPRHLAGRISANHNPPPAVILSPLALTTPGSQRRVQRDASVPPRTAPTAAAGSRSVHGAPSAAATCTPARAGRGGVNPGRMGGAAAAEKRLRNAHRG